MSVDNCFVIKDYLPQMSYVHKTITYRNKHFVQHKKLRLEVNSLMALISPIWNIQTLIAEKIYKVGNTSYTRP